MRIRPLPLLIAALLALAGCADDAEPGRPAATDGSAPAAVVLSTADSDFGEIVVDGEGMTVYVFDRDTAGSGASSCSGQCLDNWPAVTAEKDQPAVEGVSGEVATIVRDDGTRQVTLGGLPLYTYVGDSGPGDVTGQGVQGVWWVVGPDGDKISIPAPTGVPAPGY